VTSFVSPPRPNVDAVTLDTCAQEPIHIPGSIQNRGALLAVRELGLIVTQASANLEEIIGKRASEHVGQPLVELLGSDATTVLERAMAVFGDLRERNPLHVGLVVGAEVVQFDAILHRAAGGTLLIELEAANGPRPFSFPNTYQAVRGAISNLNQAASLTDLYGIAARAVRELTGFDRVMVYRYDHEFNGEVVAEEKRQDLEPFLGLHYPASDIPAQARALYEKNWIRLISDVDYRPSPIVPSHDPESGMPLDLTFSTLRSVSPIHIEYLKNMGVRASMSISLLRHGSLWGLIACHHYAGPHTPPYGVRAAAEFLGSTLSLRLVDRDEEDELRIAVEAQSILARLTSATLDESEPMASVLLASPSLLDLVSADGVAVFAEGHVQTKGAVPSAPTMELIAQWARPLGQDVVVTDALASLAPQVKDVPDAPCGVLVLQLPGVEYVMWFRSEDRKSVNWAGDPGQKANASATDEARLSPRQSFESWREIVRGRSRPWTTEECQLAADIRTHMVEALYVRSQQELRLGEILQRSLLPSTLPAVPGWSISSHYETAASGHVGGDWYDALLLDEDTLGVVLGDVAGHGIAAAGTMAQLRNALRAYLLSTKDPATAMGHLAAFATRLLPATFATAIAACIDLRRGRVRVTTAGHLAPYLLSAENEVTSLQLRISPPLGVADGDYSFDEFEIPPGSGIVLFSDGVVERRHEDIDDGLSRLVTALGRLGPKPSAAAISASVMESSAGDDTTILTVYRTGGD
jgi:chemotaxis family two-component system sensor kinase Cph1